MDVTFLEHQAYFSTILLPVESSVREERNGVQILPQLIEPSCQQSLSPPQWLPKPHNNPVFKLETKLPTPLKPFKLNIACGQSKQSKSFTFLRHTQGDDSLSRTLHIIKYLNVNQIIFPSPLFLLLIFLKILIRQLLQKG